MFNKPLVLTGHRTLSGADRKKLRRTLSAKLQCEDAALDAALPKAEELTVRQHPECRVCVWGGGAMRSPPSSSAGNAALDRVRRCQVNRGHRERVCVGCITTYLHRKGLASERDATLTGSSLGID